MWKRDSGIAGKTWLIDKKSTFRFLEDLHMHTWLATGLMGRVIRSTAPSREKRAYWGPRRRTLALVAVLAVLAFALPAAFAQQGHAAPPTFPTAATGKPQARAG